MTQLSVLIPNSVSVADSWSADSKTALSSQQPIKRTSGLLSVIFSAQPSSYLLCPALQLSHLWMELITDTWALNSRFAA